MTPLALPLLCCVVCMQCGDRWCAVVQVSGTTYVELGSPIRLICNATGRHRAPDDIGWYRAGLAIRSNPGTGVVVSKKTVVRRVLMSMLAIASSRMSDAGRYSCRTSAGDAASIDVHILNGRPRHTIQQ